ncbi:MAG: hypothetical protein H0X69_17585 [Gemmatimonadales bacterium]|nr:hypothetical protein [Gemmatimonadales bacterium]
MFVRHLIACAAVVVGAAVTGRPLAAQIDYRNLDEGRPVTTEDAYPVERYAFELVLPYVYENERGGGRTHLLIPELAYGVVPNMQVGVELPLVVLDRGGPGAGTDLGFAGPRLFALYNFNTETPTLPALAIRTDLALPLGDMAGDDVRMSLTGIATRGWGRTRAHFNAAVGLGGDGGVPAVHGIPDWAASVAVDRTFLRRSLIVIGELGAREHAGDGTEVTVGLGARMQLTPTIVLDAGAERRLGDRGPDFGLTFGLSHAFALAALMPRGAR